MTQAGLPMTRSPANRFFTLGLLTALAGCGGKSTASTSPSAPSAAGGGGDDKVAATPFDQARVKATLAAMPVPDACGGPDVAATLGALLENNRKQLGKSDTEVTFTCRPADGEPWNCDWSVLTKSTGAVDPDDPCAGQGGSGYQIMFKVAADGTIVPDSVNCIAPG